jgi:alkylhydroperoxidase family enzyme
MDDQVRAVVERSARVGVPRPESSAVRAHSLGAFWAFEDAWQKLFRSGLVAHDIKELCRIYVSRSVKCEYCGNQRSLEARAAGIGEGKLDELLNFESSEQYSEKERAALSYAEAITWRLNPDDGFWARLSRHFNEEELVELAGFISLTMGQQSWIRLLNIDHFEVLGGGRAAMAPGLDDPDALARARDSETYWAKS